MSNVVPFKGKTLVRAAELDDRHMNRSVRIGSVEGPLVGLIPSRLRVDVVLVVGGRRAFFQLDPAAHVEVGPKTTKEHR